MSKVSSSASGVEVSSNLRVVFDSARSKNDVGFIEVRIVNDALDAVHVEKRGFGGWSKDFEQIQRRLEDKQPAFFLLFKGREVVILLYMPEDALVKARMTYSSSKGALNSLVSGGRNTTNTEHYFGSSKAEFSLQAYQSHLNTKGPLSEVEEELRTLPRSLNASDAKKSQGYSLLATISNKPFPAAQLKSMSAPENKWTPAGAGQGNFFNKPSQAKAANMGNIKLPMPNNDGPSWKKNTTANTNTTTTTTTSSPQTNTSSANVSQTTSTSSSSVNKTSTTSSSSSSFDPSKPLFAPVTPSFIKPSTSTQSTSSSPSPAASTSATPPPETSTSSPSPVSSSSPSVSSSSSTPSTTARRPSVSTGKCLVSGCNSQRIKVGYCKEHWEKSQEAAATPVPSTSSSQVVNEDEIEPSA